MDLMRMEKKNNGDKYISVAAVLEDIQLLRNNAHLYNQGEIQILAGLDCKIDPYI